MGLEKGPEGLTDEFYGFKKSRRRAFFVIDSYLKDSVFTAVKRHAKFYLSTEGIKKGYLFREKWSIKE